MSRGKQLRDVIFGRRSIRRYEPRPVPRPLILELLTAATWAPSAHNRQPWRFAVIESTGQKAHLAAQMGERLQRDLTADGLPVAVIQQDVARSYQRITSAPVVILLSATMADMDAYPDKRRAGHEMTMAVQSVAMAGQNILLAAHDAGLGACWMCAPLFCPDVVRDALSLPADWLPQGMLTVGYPAQARSKTRRPLGDVTIWR
ncbi:MAG: nitroreductase family protein [Anaerolineaceae bacterium]|nr:MAG: nitroreductase family protein [Anaerolineaceae bacterium]